MKRKHSNERFLVFQVYGTVRHLHYTAFNPLSDIVRSFDPVWRLNPITIKLKTYTGINLFGFCTENRFHQSFLRTQMFPDTNYEVPGHQRFRIQSFQIQSFRGRHGTEKIYYQIRRCVCKRQHESGTKTFQFRDESENFRSSVTRV